MKIAIIAPSIWNTVHWDFARALVGDGHQVLVYTEDKCAPSGRRFTQLVRDGIECLVLSDTRRNPWTWCPDRLFKPLLGRRFFTTLSGIRRFLLRARDADVTLCEGDWMGVFVALAAHGRSSRWVVSVHDTLYLRAPIHYPGRPESRWRERLKLWVLRRASAVRANSDVTRDALVQGGCPAESIFVVPLPIARWMHLPAEPLARFRLRAREQVRQELAIAQDARVYMAMCRLDPAKGLELSVEALAQCQDKSSRLVICGGDRDVAGIGSYRALLEGLAQRLGVAERVVFAGHVAVDEVKRYLAAADLHLAPSVIDTFNYAVVEAAMVGTASLMSDKVGAAPWIVQAGAGATQAGREPVAWARAMEALSGQPLEDAARQAMSEAIQSLLSPQAVSRELVSRLATRAR